MKVLEVVPRGIEAINATYGDPDVNRDFILDSDFFGSRITVFTFPHAMRLSWKPDQYVKRFQAHVKVGPVVIDALEEVFDEIGVDKMRELGWDYWGGGFNFRKSRTSSRLSTHSWGIAVDLNPHLAPLGMMNCGQPAPIVDAFEKRGFVWLQGDFMHAQACVGY
jgi:hypothetical protein